MARIMIVDDERDVVQLIRFLLEKDGHIVTTAYNGAEALEKLGVEPRNPDAAAQDLVVIDVMMPVMDGYTACQKMGADPRTRSLPIIVLTAKGDTKELFQMAPNVASHLDKPFDPKKLRDLISSMLPPSKPEAARG
jgi:two-component system alkaline phosphatase synthesis response regulator PhoP